MKIQIERTESPFRFEAQNESGNRVTMDAGPSLGGAGAGARPMEMLLMALGGCAGIDIVSILRKQKQEPLSFSLTIDGQREQEPWPGVFHTIEVLFRLEGELDADKVKRAVQLSMEKYCSVARTLEKTATINYQIALNGVRI